MKIDFVIPWVNGNDPDWQAQRNQHCNTLSEIDESRYREWGILKYWFRAVEEYAPWVNQIHFVTCGQWPEWLNKEHPKLHFVDHKDFIPEEYLPTFNSMSIELQLHRIPGLAEHFVYFNDDVFLNRPVTPEDFFKNGLPCDCAVMTQLHPGVVFDPHIHTICNDMAIINTHFRKKEVLRSNPGKWFHPKYGKGLLKNILNFPGSQFSCFSNPHICVSMLKSVYQEIWSLEPEILDTASRQKFRSTHGINQYLIRYYTLCKGFFVPRNYDFGKCYEIGPQSVQMYRDILTKQHKVICVNDNANNADFDQEKSRLIEVFESALPEKSSFEQ